MKLIIDIPEMAYEAFKEWHKNKVATAEQSLIANGKPYEERPQGEWIENKYFSFICSNCGQSPTPFTGCNLSKEELDNHFNFCRFCGARMGGGAT